MFSHTSLTARITGIRNTTQPTSIEQRVEDLCRSDNGRLNLLSCLKKPKLVSSAPPIVSLAPQGDSQTGTVTFPLGRWKERALKRFTGWQVDDAFDGLTVLSSAPEPNLEYGFYLFCFIFTPFRHHACAAICGSLCHCC